MPEIFIIDIVHLLYSISCHTINKYEFTFTMIMQSNNEKKKKITMMNNLLDFYGSIIFHLFIIHLL
jgi:hypothetical protein